MAAAAEQRIAAVRRFSRFYTAKIGMLREGLHASPFSLAEARVLYELANRDRPTASELVRDLGLDAGYLSRILGGFERQGLLEKEASPQDRRQNYLLLTSAGRRAFAPLDSASRQEIGELLQALSEPEQQLLVAAMGSVERLLGNGRNGQVPYILRSHRPGDLGWVVSRHAALYAEEYGWDGSFEALVAGIVEKFIEHFDARYEHCWIAERDGAILGAVMLVRKSAKIAKLRLLYVEPAARGLGIGKRLVEECIRFARAAGYRRITLWTNSILLAARAIYEQAGFILVDSEKHHSFGQDLVAETWELKL
jgi:DNA-binding MarR family transcriptional regulator/N-acetylglutamate synthase-like GNAT family acetyltransferase